MDNEEKNLQKTNINWYSMSNDKPFSTLLFIRDFFDKCFTF